MPCGARRRCPGRRGNDQMADVARHDGKRIRRSALRAQNRIICACSGPCLTRRPNAPIRRSAPDELAPVRQARPGTRQVPERYTATGAQPGADTSLAIISVPAPGRHWPRPADRLHSARVPRAKPLCPWHQWAESCTLAQPRTPPSHARLRPWLVRGRGFRPRPSVKPAVTPTVLVAGRRPLYVRGHRNTGVYSDRRWRTLASSHA
jgi:hypothetical protein